MSITKVQSSQASDDKHPPPNYGACSPPPSSSSSPADKPPPPPPAPAPAPAPGHEGPLQHALSTLLTHFADAPEYNQDNPDILGGYRRPVTTWPACLRTVGGWHNESVNVSSSETGSRRGEPLKTEGADRPAPARLRLRPRVPP